MSSLSKTNSFTPPQNYTGMAQRQRAWLITTRSLDRNGLPVLSSFRTSASWHLEHKPLKTLPV